MHIIYIFLHIRDEDRNSELKGNQKNLSGKKYRQKMQRRGKDTQRVELKIYNIHLIVTLRGKEREMEQNQYLKS